MERNYFIKAGYTPRQEDAAHTAINEGESYWSDSRVDTSKYYQVSVYKQAAKLASQIPSCSVADIGCGSGYKLMHQVAPSAGAVTGYDQPFIIAECKKKYPQANWVSLDLDSDQQSDKKYDLIVCADVIEHLVDPDKLLAFIKSAAHEKTIVLISTPERDVLHGIENTSPTNRDHIREWNRDEMRQYLESKGYVVQDISLVTTLRPHLSKHYMHFLKKNIGRLKHTMLVTTSVS